jgi:hypothetical protein
MTGSGAWVAPAGVLALVAILAGFALFLVTRRRPDEELHAEAE